MALSKHDIHLRLTKYQEDTGYFPFFKRTPAKLVFVTNASEDCQLFYRREKQMPVGLNLICSVSFRKLREKPYRSFCQKTPLMFCRHWWTARILWRSTFPNAATRRTYVRTYIFRHPHISQHLGTILLTVKKRKAENVVTYVRRFLDVARWFSAARREFLSLFCSLWHIFLMLYHKNQHDQEKVFILGWRIRYTYVRSYASCMPLPTHMKIKIVKVLSFIY